MRPLVFLVMSAFAAQADMIDTSELAPYEVCGLCHSLDGNSRMAKFPKLAGQRAAYIEKQLGDFLAGHREASQMASIVTELAPEDFPVVAAWFESQPHPEPTGPGSSEGAALFAVKGCAGCHETPPAGLTVPLIASQHEAYVVRQLQNFRDGTRSNDPDGVMRKVASALADEDIDALAAFIAAQPRQ